MALVLALLLLCLPTAQADSPATTRVSVDSEGNQGDNGSYEPSTSADGRYVAFESDATNLVTPTVTSDIQVFVHDRQTDTTALVSVAPRAPTAAPKAHPSRAMGAPWPSGPMPPTW
jgi:Tol biopolymer transport system component